jgi:hypothetical protein
MAQHDAARHRQAAPAGRAFRIIGMGAISILVERKAEYRTVTDPAARNRTDP